MQRVAYALRVFLLILAELPRTTQPSLGVRPVQRDPGLSVHVRPDEPFVVPAPAVSAISTPPAPARTPVRALVGRAPVPRHRVLQRLPRDAGAPPLHTPRNS